MSAKVWTDERIAFAAKLRKSGMDYAQIAKVIGSTTGTTNRIFTRYRDKFEALGVKIARQPARKPKQPEIVSFSLRTNEAAFAAAMGAARYDDIQVKPKRIERDHQTITPFAADRMTTGGVAVYA